jgi:hypothetical protein
VDWLRTHSLRRRFARRFSRPYDSNLMEFFTEVCDGPTLQIDLRRPGKIVLGDKNRSGIASAFNPNCLEFTGLEPSDEIDFQRDLY